MTEKAPVVAEVKPVTSAPRTEDKSASTDSTGKEFVLVLDPGHGGGAAHNRGGLLFNEGDQNFIFTQKILEQAKKYKNIRTSSTRTSNNEDPAYADRANAGDGADLYVSIHTNASVPQAKGVEVWGGNDNTKTGQNLSKDITATWAKELNTTDRGVKYAQAGNRPNTTKPVKGARDPWFVFKDNEAKDKLILESVFHTNYQDSKAFLEKQDKLAENFMSIVARHYGLILK